MNSVSNWTPSELTTLLVGILGLLSALASIALSYFTSRRVSLLQAHLDLEKTTSAQFLRAYLDLKLDGREKELAGLQDFIYRIQCIRDKVRAVIASPTSFGPATLSKEIRVLIEDVRSSYAEHQVFFEEANRRAAHSLKRDIEQLVSDLLSDIFRLKVDKTDLSKYLEQEKTLAAAQYQLRERARVVINRLANEFEDKYAVSVHNMKQ